MCGLIAWHASTEGLGVEELHVHTCILVRGSSIQDNLKILFALTSLVVL